MTKVSALKTIMFKSAMILFLAGNTTNYCFNCQAFFLRKQRPPSAMNQMQYEVKLEQEPIHGGY